jgi:Ca-activated chloride channel homolog
MKLPGDRSVFFSRYLKRTMAGFSSSLYVPIAILVCFFFVGFSRAGMTLKRQKLIQAAIDSIPKDLAEKKTLSPYFFVFAEDSDNDLLPLKSTRAEVSIAGVIARVKVTQLYKNEGSQTLEAVYIFPASTRAAVHSLQMTIGKRTLKARINKRKEARQEYEKALKDGKTAALLEQQRPNVFQINVGNILPGDEIEVVLEYDELILPNEGVYEFVYPTVVGPRYSNRPEEDVDDKEKWIKNPYLHEGEKALHTFGIDLNIYSGIPIAKVTSASHDVAVEFTSKQVAHVALADSRAYGNRDFVLRYSLQADEIEHGLLLYPGPKENFFLLMMEPPERVDSHEIVDREYIFVMDVSGSMEGFPLDISKQLMHDLLSDLKTSDYFNLVLFAGSNKVLSKESQAASPENIQDAIDLIDTQSGGGGTELLPALTRAINLPHKEGTSRILVILSDGYVDVERESFALIRKNLNKANVFAFGIGSSVNRSLIEGLARAGMGEPFVALDEKEARRQADRFRKYIESPVLSGISVDFEGFEAYDLHTQFLPDLFAERPLILFGKYKPSPKGSIVIHGQVSSQEMEGRINLSDAVSSKDNAALRTMWARHKVASLTDRLSEDSTDTKLIEEVTKLGLDYSLLTEYTSFVVVDTKVRADGKRITKVRQPLPLPVGVSDNAIGTSGAGLGKVRGRVYRSMPMARTVMGSISRSEIQRGIRKNMRAIKYCYEKALKSDPGLSGKIVVEFVIGPKGTVTNAKVVTSTVKSHQFQADILNVIRRMRFPKPAGGGSIVVAYPFIFRSVD